MEHFLPAALASCLLAGCTGSTVTVEQKLMDRKNPVSYEFPTNMEAIKSAINEARGEKWRDSRTIHQRPLLSWKQDHNPFAVFVFAKPENKDDAFLSGMGDSVGLSDVYYKSGKQLPYYADFQIHLTPQSLTRTRVQIITYDSYVEAGSEWHPFAIAAIYASVPPTTVEEYQILLDIAFQLNITNMPQLITPKPDASLRKLTVPQRR